MEHRLLDNGVTGFHRIGTPQPPSVSEKQILSDCHHVAIELGWTAGSLERAETAQNFHWVRLSGDNDAVSVFFNRHYPLIAFSDDMPTGLSHTRFRECAVLADAFQKLTQFRPIAMEDLERPVEQADLSHLNATEIEQANSWRPARVGDLIFNFWD